MQVTIWLCLGQKRRKMELWCGNRELRIWLKNRLWTLHEKTIHCKKGLFNHKFMPMLQLMFTFYNKFSWRCPQHTTIVLQVPGKDLCWSTKLCVDQKLSAAQPFSLAGLTIYTCWCLHWQWAGVESPAGHSSWSNCCWKTSQQQNRNGCVTVFSFTLVSPCWCTVVQWFEEVAP